MKYNIIKISILHFISLQEQHIKNQGSLSYMIANVQGNTLDNNNKKKNSLITNINEPSFQPNKSSHYGD